MKDELSGEIMKDFPTSKAKTWRYLPRRRYKSKSQKSCNMKGKGKLRFADYKHCLEIKINCFKID